MFMGKVVVSIPLITWRQILSKKTGQVESRPRFSPGPRLRKPPFSMKGEDLRHPDGRWYSIEEAIAWAEARQALITQVENAAPRQRRAIARAGTAMLTIGQLFDEWFRQPRMNAKAEVEGKKTRAPLAANTVANYRDGARLIEKLDDGLIWHSPAAAISGTILGNEDRGVFHKLEVLHGLSSARKARAALSAMFSWAKRKGRVTANPVLGSVQLPTPDPRVRYGSIVEMHHMVRAAHAIGRPEIALAHLLGLWSAQRQNDRLNLTDGQDTPDGIVVRQLKKRGQPLLIPKAPELSKEIAATKHRRRDWRVNYPHLVLDEKTRRPFDRHAYNKTYARVRAFAVTGQGVHEITGEPVTIAPMPSLADWHDQDLRDTAVTWLALGGATVPEIAAITGHSLETINTILKHYLGMHPELARSAIAKLVAWYDGQGEAK